MAVKIFIDQGHNPCGFNSGSEANGLKEADINYYVGMKLAALLKADDRFEVLTSRTCVSQILGYDNTSALEERVWKANTWGADYFLSIHCNFSDNPNANGSEIFVYKSKSSAEYLAQSILEQIVEQLDTRNRGVKVDPDYYVLRKTTMPANLIELAFISNTQDAEKLENCQEQFAIAIYDGLVNYLFG